MDQLRGLDHIEELVERLSRKSARVTPALEALDLRDLQLLVIATAQSDEDQVAKLHMKATAQLAARPSRRKRRVYELVAGAHKGNC